MRIGVLGSGNGGCAVACDCAMRGHQVSLFDFPEFPEQVAAIAERGGISAEGKITGFGKIAYAGSDLERVVTGADIVFAVGPAWSTRPFGEACGPHLRSGQLVVVCPGSGLGSVEFKNALGMDIRSEEIVVAETHTLPYGVRLSGPASIRVGTKLGDGLFLAALPREQTERTVQRVRQVYPFISPARSVLQTTMQNGNPVIHPAISLLNVGPIDRLGRDFLFYREGATPGVGRLLEGVDRERIAIGAALGIEVIPEPVLGVRQGYMQTADYETGYMQSESFKQSKAPGNLNHRYIQEDTGYGLVLWADLARLAGVETPIIDSVITLLGVVCNKDFRRPKARTLESLGLGGCSRDELMAIL